MKSSLFVSHLAAAIIISGIILFIYAGVQQVHRSMANDPQLQLARDLRDAVANGKSTAHLIPPDTINLDKSDAVFTVVYNSAGMPLQTTALLGNKVPQIPKGVMEFTNQYLEDAVTWQPNANIRLAMVVEKIPAPGSGFVAVGRSLKETEIRTSFLINMMLITWASCMGILLLHFLFCIWINKRTKP